MIAYDLDIANRIKERIHHADPAAKVILFGSRARGDTYKDSDWDILVLVENPMQTRSEDRKFRNQVFDLELEIEQPISVLVISMEEWLNNYVYSSLYKCIKEEGILL